MTVEEALLAVRHLRERGLIRDYMLFGSVAAMAYSEPILTQDVDVAIAVDSDEEFIRAFRALSAGRVVDGQAVVISGTPIEMFPANMHPVLEDALTQARRRRLGRIMVKVAPPEHLLVLALELYRPKDRQRAALLLDAVDDEKLGALLRRFDRDGTLGARLQRIAD